MSDGPLTGLRVVEAGGIGPSTFAAMVMCDLGADVVRFDRPAAVDQPARELDFLVTRGRRSIAVDLRSDAGRDVALALIAASDVVIEGFRPGVVERLGIGPADCADERLIYARATGWGQEGPWSQVPGHDINYIAVTGALHAIGRKDSPPPPPLNLIGDYGGGGMLCVVGILAALHERQRSGVGQVIDAAMVDGVSLLSMLFFGTNHLGALVPERESNNIDGGAPWYDSYACSDGKYVCVGGGEPHFFSALCVLLELEDRFDDPFDRSRWPEIREAFTERIATRTRDDWAALIGDPTLCMSPVLTWDEAPHNVHLVARSTFVEHDGITQPAPAPRFGRTPGRIRRPPPWPGEHTAEILSDWAVPESLVRRAADSVRQRPH